MTKLAAIFNVIRNHAGNGRWFEIKNTTKDKVAEITIMDEIGGWGVNAGPLCRHIKSLGDDVRIKLHIFSPGGDVMEGNEIYNALKAHKGGVDVTCGAMCASIATVIACAGDTIKMAKNGLFMIHNPWTFAMGEADDLRRLASVMDKMKENITDAYAERTGMPKEDLAVLMDKESWFTASEAKDQGFINDVLDWEDPEGDTIKDRFDLGKFKNALPALSRLPQKQVQNKPAPPVGNNRKPEGDKKPQPVKPKSNLKELYMTGKTRIFNTILTGSIFAMAARPMFFCDPPGERGGNTTEEIDPEAVKAAARELYKAKIQRDKEIDDIVAKVRTRDKKDFSDLANRFKQEDKTVDEFARAIALSDEFKPHEVVGSGIEVVGVQGLPKGTPGEAFVASEGYKALVDRMKRGSRARDSVLVETKQFIAAELQNFMNVTTTTGLTSIEKLPGIVTLGVRPLTVKDLISPGSTNATQIRYMRETSFTNAATTVAEGAAKPAASFALEEINADVTKIAAYTKVTDELFQDFLAVASYINMRLPYMVERTEEDQLLNGDGTGVNMTGIMNTTGVQTLARGTDVIPDAIYKAFTKVRWGNLAGTAQGGFEPDGIVMHPTNWEVLRLSKDANEQYYAGGPFTGAYGNGGVAQFEMLWGKPVVVTPAIAVNTALVGAFRLASQYFMKQGMTIESTNSDQDDFIKNLTTIRAELRLALAVYRPEAFCKVTGLNLA